MATLNYHHLLYFGAVARTGSVARAAAELNLTQPAVSAQIRTLERRLGHQLLERRGRGVIPTDVGRVVARYAEEIAGLGRGLEDALEGRAPDRLAPLRIGVVNALPKLLVHRLLQPVLDPAGSHRLVVYEDKPDRLLADLAIHELDVVFADAPAPASLSVRAYSHPVLRAEVAFFGAPAEAAARRRRFPSSLEGAPWLAPTTTVSLRRSLDAWFHGHGIRPRIVAEVEDSAVVKVFASRGAGICAAPAFLAGELARQYGLRLIGTIPTVREELFAITVERRITHPGIRTITDTARASDFMR